MLVFQSDMIVSINRLRFGTVGCAAVLLLITSTGCNSAASGEPAAELHEEHYVPPHKPANFSEAVQAIDRRSDYLSDHAGHSHGDEAEKLAELADIIGWIPELAADSDLSEPDWNTAAAAGKSMGTVLSRLMSAQQPDLSRLHSDLSSAVAELRTLVPKAGPPEARIEHDHHHHGDHHHDDEDDDGHDHDHDHDHDPR
jgi:hypothetical protein